jgi:AraC-like DNA-binding protein
VIVKILYSAASIQGVFLAVLIFRTRVNQPANRILGILLLLISFHLVLVGFDEREFFMKFPHLSRVSWIIGSLYWPLLFLFVQHLTQTQPEKIWKSFWTFVPFLVLLIVMLPYYTKDAETKRRILDNFESASAADFGLVNQIVSVLHVVFALFFLFYYLRFEKRLFNEYSEIESIRIKWLKQFLLGIMGVTVVAVVAFFARGWNIPLFSRLYDFHFIGIVILFYWLSYQALTHPVLFGIGRLHPVSTPVELSPASTLEINDSPGAPDEGTAKYRKSTLDEFQRREIFEKVKAALEGQKLYLKGDLALSDLSAVLAIPKHQISESISSCYTGNFFDLINSYRIEAFKTLALDETKKHLSLLGIAQEAGFNSKATFYTVFRKRTGMTPTKFLEKSRESDLIRSEPIG